MNAPTKILHDAQASYQQHLRFMADAILVGDFDCLPKVERELYTTQEWFEAAEEVEAGEYADFRYMLERERVYQDWMRLSEREQDAWAGFDNFFDRMAPKVAA